MSLNAAPPTGVELADRLLKRMGGYAADSDDAAAKAQHVLAEARAMCVFWDAAKSADTLPIPYLRQALAKFMDGKGVTLARVDSVVDVDAAAEFSFEMKDTPRVGGAVSGNRLDLALGDGASDNQAAPAKRTRSSTACKYPISGQAVVKIVTKATQKEIDKIVEWTALSEDELSDRLFKNEKEGDRDVPDLLLMVFSSDSDCAEAGGWIAEIVRLRPAFYDTMARVMCGARSVRLIHSEVVKTAVRALCHDVTKLDVCALISATSLDDPSWMDPPSQAQCDGFEDESGVVGKPGATVPIMMGTCISEVAQVTELLENVMDILYGGKGAWEQMRKLYLALLRTPIEKEVVYRLFAKIFTHVRDGVKSHCMGSGNRKVLHWFKVDDKKARHPQAAATAEIVSEYTDAAAHGNDMITRARFSSAPSPRTRQRAGAKLPKQNASDGAGVGNGGGNQSAADETAMAKKVKNQRNEINTLSKRLEDKEREFERDRRRAGRFERDRDPVSPLTVDDESDEEVDSFGRGKRKEKRARTESPTGRKSALQAAEDMPEFTEKNLPRSMSALGIPPWAVAKAHKALHPELKSCCANAVDFGDCTRGKTCKFNTADHCPHVKAAAKDRAEVLNEAVVQWREGTQK
jgi:hypothetical protein